MRGGQRALPASVDFQLSQLKIILLPKGHILGGIVFWSSSVFREIKLLVQVYSGSEWRILGFKSASVSLYSFCFYNVNIQKKSAFPILFKII